MIRFNGRHHILSLVLTLGFFIITLLLVPTTAWRKGRAEGFGALLFGRSAFQILLKEVNNHASDARLPVEADVGIGAASSVVRVYVGVMSRNVQFQHRQAIRNGWGADAALYRLRFFLLQPPNTTLAHQAELELLEHQDLVMLPAATEHYKHIGNATLEILRCASSDPLVTHVLKIDDDVYLRPQPLLRLLRTLPPTALYLGEFVQWWCPAPDSECYMTPPPQNMSSVLVSAPYACGAAYVMSIDLAQSIAAAASLQPHLGRDGTLKHNTPYRLCQGHHVLANLTLEDLAVGCVMDWLDRSSKLRVHRVDEPRFRTRNSYTGCEEDAIAMHGTPPHRQLCMARAGGRCSCGTDG